MSTGQTGQGDARQPAVRAGVLYLVATPIGNLGDITERAQAVLRGVDLVAAEDTRHTRGLLAHLGASPRLLAVHEHNERTAVQALIQALGDGQSVALVTDAGTPGISDPGARAVAGVRAAGFAVSPVPGACAAVAALSASGVDARSLFYGFLPPKSAARRKALEALGDLPFALVFYEAPHRVEETVADLDAILGGERLLVLARELTKLFESIHCCPLAEAGAWLAGDPNRQRGEFVLIVGPPAAPAADALAPETMRTLEVLVRELPVKQAVSLAAEITGAPRNALYPLALTLSGK